MARTHRFSVIFAKVQWHPCNIDNVFFITDIAVARKRRGAKSSEDKENMEKAEDDNSDSDFEPASVRKRFKSTLLNAKVSDSDSDIEVNKKKRG